MSRRNRPQKVSYRPEVELLECRNLLSAGVLDPSFGTGGLTTPLANVNIFSSDSVIGPGLVVQPDGKVLVAQTTNSGGVTVDRLNKNGTPDSSFGTASETTISGAGTFRNLALQPDGKILVVGTTGDFTVARLNQDGSADTSFGAAGLTAIDFAGGFDVPFDLVVKHGGKILLAGTTTNFGFPFTRDFAVAQLNGDGSPDSSFGTAGQTTIAFPGNDVETDFIVPSHSLVLQPDGKILVAATAVFADGTGDFAIARLDKDGNADSGFGLLATPGQTTIHFPGTFDFNICTSLAVQPDGKILAAGTTFNLDPAQTDFALARLNKNGTLDSSFGTAGETTIDFGGSDLLSSMALLPDHKIVVSGTTTNLQTGFADFAVARLSKNGSLDNSFGTAGQTTINFGGGGVDFTSTMVVQPDGKILIGGTVFTATADFALARLKKDGTPDTSFGTAGQTTTDFAGGQETLTRLVLLPDGNILAVGLTFEPPFSFSVALAEYSGGPGHLGAEDRNDRND